MAFNRLDHRVAHAAWQTYMHEIHGRGLRCELNVGPDNIDRILRSDYARFGPPDHLWRTQEYDRRVKRLGGLASQLSRFVDRPVVIPRRLHLTFPDPSHTFTRGITEGEIDVFRGFHAAIEVYLAGISGDDCSPSDETRSALQLVGQYVDPIRWVAAGYDVPAETSNGVIGTSVCAYLEDVMALTDPQPADAVWLDWQTRLRQVNP